MKALALIPARHGSKRLPGKNLKILGDKPLISWTIEIAKKTPALFDVMVSTDSEEIASIARDAGVKVPWLRPVHLASDCSSTVDVAIHALDWYEEVHGNVEALVLLQPTSPFRTINTIEVGIKAFEEFSKRPVLSVSPQASITSDSFIQRGNFIYKFQGKVLSPIDEEDSLVFCVPNGVLYVISPLELRSERSFAAGEIVPLFIDSDAESIDIDTLDDWLIAEKVVEANRP